MYYIIDPGACVYKLNGEVSGWSNHVIIDAIASAHKNVGKTPTPGLCDRCHKYVEWNWVYRRYEVPKLMIEELP